MFGLARNVGGLEKAKSLSGRCHNAGFDLRRQAARMTSLQLAGVSNMRASTAKMSSAFVPVSLLCLSLLTIVPSPADAGFPDKLIKIVVPFAAGGSLDVVARPLVDFLSKDLGKAVIIENKPGAASIVGTEAVARSTPDGYTLLLTSTPFVTNPSIRASLPFDTFKAFAPVALVARYFDIVVVSSKLPFKSVQDVIAYAKANPNKLNFGSPGIGTSQHLAGELFKSMAHVDMIHVPYKGTAPAITDLLSGQIQIMFSTVPGAAPFIQGGQLRALAITSVQRSTAFPDLPTVAEADLPGFVVEGWYGLLAPAGTPAEIINLLNASVEKAIRSSAFKTIEANDGLTFAPGTPEDFGRYLQSEAARWRDVVKDAHIQAQ
jgi:tripartite-type tricarboxylate transporter receptor subunit TctC